MSLDAACLTIDLDALAANYRLLRGMAGAAETAPVVKADGYGMGAVQAARRLWAEGARTFYVARAHEGEALRAGLDGRPGRILVFDGALPGTAARLRAADLVPVLNTEAQVAAWRGAGGGAAALHVDTGMNRLGLTLEAAGGLDLAGIEPVLVMSHLACAAKPESPMNGRQLARFGEVRRLFPGVAGSLSSSGGIFLGGDYLQDQVRPGISLYGGGPHDAHDPRLAAVAKLEAPILQVRRVEAGESVGYGRDFVAEAPLTVGVLGAGYADGYLRASSPRGAVWFEGGRRRLLGRISMDLTAVDLTGTGAREGDLVELIGPNLPLDDAAQAAVASTYEFLVRMGRRSERRWTQA